MPIKALIIDVREDKRPTGDLGKWNQIGNITEFVNSITTPDLADSRAMISGMPSIFARSKMFKLAFDSGSSSVSPSMRKVYAGLREEWKGFVACIALNPALRVERVELKYSDGKSITDTENPYEPLGALANMLFDERPVWSVLNGDQIADAPFIDVVKLDGMVLGATCPHTLLFTAASYSVNDSRYSQDGRFAVNYSNLAPDDILKLYAYVSNMQAQLADYESSFAGLSEDIRPKFQKIESFVSDWLKEIRSKAVQMRLDLDIASTNDISGFQAPYDVVFNCSDELWGRNGVIYSTEGQGLQAFHPKDLLLPEATEIAQFHFLHRDIRPSELPVYLLEATKKGSNDKAYFALPFTSKGLSVFGQRLGSMLDKANHDVQTNIDAIFDESCFRLEVTLTLSIDGRKRKSVSSFYYSRKRPIQNTDLLLWPNFISTQWTKYFLYSELPHSPEVLSDFHATPFAGSLVEQEFRPVVGADGNPLLLTARNDELEAQGVRSETLVRANGDPGYQYDIYESNKPFYGIRLTHRDQDAGLLVIHYGIEGVDTNPNLPLNRLNVERRFRHEVELGFDLGSKNTSVAYHVRDTHELRALEFKARRKSLLGLDNVERRVHPRDFLFFYNPKTLNGRSTVVRSNGIKSMIALHNPNLLRRREAAVMGRYGLTEDALKERYVSGGFPCIASNLPLSGVDNENDQFTLIFNEYVVSGAMNLKYRDNPADIQHLKSFIRTTMLYVYAELFDAGCKPVSLNWSYPAAMTTQDVSNRFSEIWRSLDCNPRRIPAGRENDAISPILDNEGNMVPLVVRNFARTAVMDGEYGDLFGMVSSTEEKTVSSDVTSSNIDDGNGIWGPWPDDSEPAMPERSYADILKKEDPQARLVFVDLNTDDPMTEAEAVANYSIQHRDGGDTLLLCFDVGGSTTDISALYTIGGDDLMIKQSSVGFAASLISRAAGRFHEEFRTVLHDLCEVYHLRINGFNYGTLCYDSQTAPFFYEQIVDTLQPDELCEFYHKIAAKSPKLFAVNLYVTGLIMFYAGQLSRKIFDVLVYNDPQFRRKATPSMRGGRPAFRFQPTFKGKGGRIFEWLKVRNVEDARNYFSDMFVEGFGRPAENRRQVLSYLDLDNLLEYSADDVKMEVSGGLALGGRLRVPNPDADFEIFGEENFKAEDGEDRYEYKFFDGLTKAKMELVGNIIFQDPKENPCFRRFIDVYRRHTTALLGIQFNDALIENNLRRCDIGEYIRRQCPEFLKAQMDTAMHGVSFGFVSPIIIQEAIKYYKDTLLNSFR